MNVISLLAQQYPSVEYWREQQERLEAEKIREPAYSIISHWSRCEDWIKFVDKIISYLECE